MYIYRFTRALSFDTSMHITRGKKEEGGKERESKTERSQKIDCEMIPSK